jgi:hypothetical protein
MQQKMSIAYSTQALLRNYQLTEGSGSPLLPVHSQTSSQLDTKHTTNEMFSLSSSFNHQLFLWRGTCMVQSSSYFLSSIPCTNWLFQDAQATS